MPPQSIPVIERLLRRIEIDDNGCWLWQGATNKYGYGVIGLLARPKPRMAFVHRVTYEHCIGPIPDRFHIDHLCHVRRCCNPDHLEAVTAAENSYRSPLIRPHLYKTLCPQGHVREWRSGRFICRKCQVAAVQRSKARRLAL